ncbi:unnamed protein product [Larinioides sclopetarius]|uniref:Uncharacterized protein n=1 Tax=Larinioides sclopetarius TaxID=280406 RepID=A0AAV2AFL0_9ARAC
MEHLLIKWKEEDCWDVIPFPDAYICDEVGERKQVNINDAIVGTDVKVEFEGEDHLAVILEVKKRCKILIREFENKETEKSLGNKRKPVPNRRFFIPEDENLLELKADKDVSKAAKRRKNNHLLLTALEKKVEEEGENVCSNYREKYHKSLKKIAHLEKEINELKEKLHFYESLNHVHELQKQAKIARCKLQNIIQFNGYYGCSWCEHKGVSVDKGHGRVMSYTLQGRNDNAALRTQSTFFNAAKQAVEKDVRVLGVKGPRILNSLNNFNIISGFITDYMHCVCLGIVRQFTMLWLVNSSSHEDFHLTSQQQSDISKSNVFNYDTYGNKAQTTFFGVY